MCPAVYKADRCRVQSTEPSWILFPWCVLVQSPPLNWNLFFQLIPSIVRVFLHCGERKRFSALVKWFVNGEKKWADSNCAEVTSLYVFHTCTWDQHPPLGVYLMATLTLQACEIKILFMWSIVKFPCEQLILSFSFLQTPTCHPMSILTRMLIRNILPTFVCESLIFFRLLSHDNLEGISTMRIYCPKVTLQTISAL